MPSLLRPGGLGIALCLLLGAETDAQTVIQVPTDFPTIQAAIDAAFDGDEVVIADGTYTGPGNVNMTFGGKLITVRSASGDPTTCIIDCQGVQGTRAFEFNSGETAASIVDGLTFTNGLMSGLIPLERGAAMHIAFNSSPTVRNCIFDNNQATYGAAVLVFSSAPSFESCSFIDNGGPDTLNGGAFENLSATASLTRCVFWGNSAASAGGAIGSETDGLLTVTHCTLSGNSAGTGAALFSGSGSQVNVTSCIFWDDLGDAIGLGGGGVDVTYSVVPGGFIGAGNIPDDPLFIDAILGDFHLLPGSPCIDTGNPVGPPDPDGSAPDMGAFPFSSSSGGTTFVRGDASGDGVFSALVDGLFMLNFGFVPGSATPPCMAAADADGDDPFSALVDGLFTLNFGFVQGSPPIPPPFPDCGEDEDTVAALGCDTRSCP